MNTGDIGLDEIARTIYKEGKADIPCRVHPRDCEHPEDADIPLAASEH